MRNKKKCFRVSVFIIQDCIAIKHRTINLVSVK